MTNWKYTQSTSAAYKNITVSQVKEMLRENWHLQNTIFTWKKKLTNYLTHTRELGRHFPENDISEPIVSGKSDSVWYQL